MLLLIIVYAMLSFKYCVQCPLEYSVIDPYHSYCSEPYPDVKDQELTLQERHNILSMHNHERRLVRGTNMQKMYWNDDLADIALRYARTCRFAHDRDTQRSVPKIPLTTGQNLAMGYKNWTNALHAWIKEKEHYYYDYPAAGMIGHYVQMIWHSTALVGCASTICPPYGSYRVHWPFYVCNYITGHLHPDAHKPYEKGFNDQPLHDCHGKVCLYNGTLDLDTCECKCSTYATGRQCERLDCSIAPQCPDYLRPYCDAFNIPSQCPDACGLCDRYEVLKHVYGENNLTPIRISSKPRIMLPEQSSSKTSEGHSSNNKSRYQEEHFITDEDDIFSIGTQIASTNIFYTIISFSIFLNFIALRYYY